MYNAPHGVTKKSCLHVVDLITFPVMLLTNQTQHFVLNRATCIYLFLAISLIT